MMFYFFKVVFVNSNNVRMSPLHYAARYGHEEVLETLIKMGAKTNCKQKYGWRPIHEAAMNGKLECLDLLLRCGSHVNAKTGLTTKGMTPLHYAVKYGHLECVKVEYCQAGGGAVFFVTSYISIPIDFLCKEKMGTRYEFTLFLFVF